MKIGTIGTKIGLGVDSKILALLEVPKVISAQEEVVPAVAKTENPNAAKINTYPDQEEKGKIIDLKV